MWNQLSLFLPQRNRNLNQNLQLLFYNFIKSEL